MDGGVEWLRLEEEEESKRRSTAVTRLWFLHKQKETVHLGYRLWGDT